MKQYIAIAGNIGAGKTTTAELLSNHFQIGLYLEKFLENPYLSDFYSDMQKWSFHSQLFFLTKNFSNHLEIQHSPNSCIQDRTIYEDSEIFAANLYQQGSMSRRDYQTYAALYTEMLKVIKYPTLIIYLQASTPNLIERIHSRNRDFEKNITQEYLRQLNSLYETWIEKVKTKTEVVTIDTNQMNLLTDSTACQAFFARLKSQYFLGKFGQ
jgi:deoxyadenosine/deoxycytidine kinase